MMNYPFHPPGASLALESEVSDRKLFKPLKKFTLLIANDDENVGFFIEEALQDVDLAINCYLVEDGAKLLDYLERRGKYADSSHSPRPDLILLDLNMPRLDGREALAKIKSNSKWKHIPIVILTTSHQEEEVTNCYYSGANSFIIKPLTYKGWVKIMRSLCHYWFEMVALPGDR